MYHERLANPDFLGSLMTPASGVSGIERVETRATPVLEDATRHVIYRSDEPSKRMVYAPVETTEAEQAFDRLVALKMSASEIAMHLDGAWRAGMFRQLDSLLDADEWDFSEQMP